MFHKKMSKDKIIQIAMTIIIIILIIALFSILTNGNTEKEEGTFTTPELQLKFGETLINTNKESEMPTIGSKTISVPKQSTTTTTPTTTQSYKNNSNCKPALSGKSSNEFKAILLNWTACSNDDFQFYKVVKSSLNSNPTYPENNVILSSSNRHISNFIDKVVTHGTTYNYKVCVVQKLKKISCGNVISVKY